MYLVAPLVALGLAGCRDFGFEARDPWRAEAEERCIAEKLVQPSAYVEPESAIEGRGACGMNHPFMPIEVKVVDDADYAAWLASSKKKFASLDTDVHLAAK